MEWRKIPGFSNYEASSCGMLRSLNYKRTGKQKILQPADSGGYLKTMIKSDSGKYCSKTVHFFVTLAFFGERPRELEVNHIDGNKYNNAIENLEYCTRSENCQHSFDIGLQKPKRGELNGNSKLKIDDVESIRNQAKNSGRYYGRKNLAEKYGISEAHVKDIVNGRRNVWQGV